MKLKLILLSLTLALMAACSSGGGTSPKGSQVNNPSAPGQNNEKPESDEISLAMVNTALNAINSDGAPGIGIPLGSLTDITQSDAAILLGTIPFSATTTDEHTQQGSCGGTLKVTTTTSYSSSANVFPFESKSRHVYTDYCDTNNGGAVIINGSGEINGYYEAFDKYTSTSYFDWHFKHTATEQVSTYKYSYTCSVSGATSSCTDGVWYASASGRNYTLNDTTVKQTGDLYEVSGTFDINGTNSTYTYKAQNLMLCDNGKIGSGTIEIAVNNTLYIRVEFVSCSQFSYYADGTSGVIDY